MPKNHRFMLKIARKTPNFAIFHLFWVYFSPLKQTQGLFFSLPPAERILKYIHPRIRGKKPRLLDPHGFVMMYIQTDGAKKFFKCQECAEGCEIRVSLAQCNAKQHSHDNKMVEK